MIKRLICGSTCAALCLILLPLQDRAHAGEKRIHAKVGSYWNYTLTDEIKNTKSLLQLTLTEIKDDQRVVKQNNSVLVYDENWNLIEGGAWKTEPHLGDGLPDGPLEVGAQSTAEATTSVQLSSGWTDPEPINCEQKITAAETVTTKAGKFDTYRVEDTCKFSNPAQPLTVIESKTTLWFSPRVDHYVKAQFEQRSDGRLAVKTNQELIQYKLR
jgi:hypothetical protein